MKNLIESIVKNILKESEEEYSFLKKVQVENPSLYSRFYSIVKNKGLEVAKEKYKEYDPELIKQKEKEKAKLDKQITKIEKDSKAYGELNLFIEFLNNIRKKYSINKNIANELKSNKLKTSGLRFTSYKTVDHITPLYNSNPNRLKYQIDNQRILPFETTEIYNKSERLYGDGGDIIIIKSYLNPEEEDITFDIKFHLYSEYWGGRTMKDKIIDALKDRWNDKYLRNLKPESLYNVIDDFINDFSEQSIENLRFRILAKRN